MSDQAEIVRLEAEYERRRMVEKITRCTCSWPLVRYRNGDGHDSKCPAHTPFEKRHSDGDDA